ncbi:hypothetical protein [Schlesneria paludicola]|uniref:hypothetical protein n=1 Tax=Schlesneria paludicola TaxID=360056 RepID=UPI00029A80BF|nr:hypothetical protein [Schlesneria paludicola]
MQKRLSLFVVILWVSQVLAAPPLQESVAPVLGPKLFRDGDVIEITDVMSTSTKLEQGDSITVKGRARLHGQATAQLALELTQTVGDGLDEGDRFQRKEISKEMTEFELKITIKHRGALHITFYDMVRGKPFGGVYFGTAKQMKEIGDWSLAYYLEK